MTQLIVNQRITEQQAFDGWCIHVLWLLVSRMLGNRRHVLTVNMLLLFGVHVIVTNRILDRTLITLSDNPSKDSKVWRKVWRRDTSVCSVVHS